MKLGQAPGMERTMWTRTETACAITLGQPREAALETELVRAPVMVQELETVEAEEERPAEVDSAAEEADRPLLFVSYFINTVGS